MLNLTEQEKRAISRYFPNLGGRSGGNGIDLPARLQELIDAQNSVISGVVTVADGATTGTAAVGAAYDGKAVLVSFGEAPTAATWAFGSVSGGTLTVTLDQDNTADLAINYLIDGR